MQLDRLDKDKGDFNSGLAIIYRLDEIHKRLHSARENKDYEVMYSSLISFFIELVRGMKPEEYTKQLSIWDKVKSAYFELRKLNSEGKPIRADLYETFYYWEIELTKIEQSLAWGMKQKTDSRYALSN